MIGPLLGWMLVGTANDAAPATSTCVGCEREVALPPSPHFVTRCEACMPQPAVTPKLPGTWGDRS